MTHASDLDRLLRACGADVDRLRSARADVNASTAYLQLRRICQSADSWEKVQLAEFGHQLENPNVTP